MAPPGKRPGQTVPPVLPASCVQLNAPPFTPVSHRRNVGSALRLGPALPLGAFFSRRGDPLSLASLVETRLPCAGETGFPSMQNT